MLLHTRTKDEFKAERIQQIIAEYACTLEEATECFGLQVGEHFSACYAFVSDGGELRDSVLDSLSDGNRYVILHDFPGQHKEYAPPHIRAEWEQAKPLLDAEREAERKRKEYEDLRRLKERAEEDATELAAKRERERVIAAVTEARAWWSAHGIEDMERRHGWDQKAYDKWVASRKRALRNARAKGEHIPQRCKNLED